MNIVLATRIRAAAERLLASRLAVLQAALDAAGLRAGDRVVLVMDNTATHAGLLLLLIERAITPLLMSTESTVVERAAQLSHTGCRSIIELTGGFEMLASTPSAETPTSNAPADVCDPGGPGIFLLTSGSTGRPSLVFRSLDSWIFEARRYGTLLQLEPRHVVLLAAPLSHAYLLGWLWASIEAGCSVEIVRPTELGAITSALRSRATHCALTPTLASLLARRTAPAGRPALLEVVMVGAGPVDAALEDRFKVVFGLGLSRNYGSTESGALCAGLAPLPPLSLGALMPQLRLVGAPEATDRKVFPLAVELEDGRIYRTGDLACHGEAGLLLVGREGSAIRRGERWVSPFEIESVLRTHPDVLDCSVRAVTSSQPGNDHIFASLVLRHGRTFDASALRTFCAGYLSRSKVPDRFEQVPAIARNAQGKTVAAKRYRSAAPAALIEAAMAYKRAHLLFALLDGGVLAGLDNGHSVDRIAYQQGLHADALARALELAHWLGLVEPTEGASPGGFASADVRHVLELERLLDAGPNSTTGLRDLLRDGHLESSLRAASTTQELPSLYQRAMNGTHKQLAMRSAMRELGSEGHPAAFALLDVSATGGGYTRWLHQRDHLDLDRSARLQVGGLTPDAACPVRDLGLNDIDPNGPRFDLLVFDNATHHCAVVQQLPALVAQLSPGGRVIVDEIFIEPGNATVGIDWLSHGGLCLPTEADLLCEFTSLGLVLAARIRIPSPVLHQVLLFKPKD